MASIELLPERCRSCVSWEVPAAAAAALSVGDAAFEKEVWLSGVMLTWGSAGQIVTVDDEAVGFALYAPPTAVPVARAFPTAPVSPDAVLLTTARIREEFTGQGLGRFLMNGVVTSLAKRGVRAIELFGREADADRPPLADGLPACLLPAAFARAVGFHDIQSHHRYPRLRYDLDGQIGWKAEVESALERLFTVITVPAPPVAEPSLVGSSGSARTPSARGCCVRQTG